MSNIENSICQFQNCRRIATYRKLKVAHLKDTKYEFCGYHRPINSINKKFPYKSIFDKINIDLKYYNHQNEYIVHEYHDYIHNLLKNHKFKFPIKITAFAENLVYDIDYMNIDFGIDITHITNYENYFNTDTVSKKHIYDLILEFQNYYNKRKIEMLYIYLDQDYDIDDVIKEFRSYTEEIKVNDIITEFKNNYKEKTVKLDNIFNPHIDFREYFKQQKINTKKLILDFEKYYNKKKLQMFIDENDYDDLLIQFDELDYKVKDDLSLKITFDVKYNRQVYLELCLLIAYQIDKVTRSFEILNKNDIESTLEDIKKNINENFEKLSKNSRDQFLCYKKLEINVFKYQALKKHMGSYIELPKSLQRQGLINIKNR